MSIAERSAEKFIRNALRTARKGGKRIVQKGCRTFRHCGPGLGGGCCGLCALLLANDVDKNANELENAGAELLGVDYDWMMSFLQGWDGDESCANGFRNAFILGKKLWKEYGDQDEQVSRV